MVALMDDDDALCTLIGRVQKPGNDETLWRLVGIRTFDFAVAEETVEAKAVAPTSAEAMGVDEQKNLKVMKVEASSLDSGFNRERGLNSRIGL